MQSSLALALGGAPGTLREVHQVPEAKLVVSFPVPRVPLGSWLPSAWEEPGGVQQERGGMPNPLSEGAGPLGNRDGLSQQCQAG